MYELHVFIKQLVFWNIIKTCVLCMNTCSDTNTEIIVVLSNGIEESLGYFWLTCALCHPSTVLK